MKNWIKSTNVAQYQGASWANWITTQNFASADAAEDFAAKNPAISFFFYCRQPMVLTNGRSFKTGDAAFFSGAPWFGSAPQCDTYRKITFNPPAFVEDFPAGSPQQGALAVQWNDNISGFTQQAIVGDPWNLLYASNQTSYFDTVVTPLPASAAAVIVTWHAFPNRLTQYLGQGAYPANPYNYTPQQLLALADQYDPSGAIPSFEDIPTQLCPQANWQSPLHMYGPYGPRGWQDEYCEWSVVRDPASGKVVRIDFTCENPEYWNTLWMTDPQKVADLYSATLSMDAPPSQQVTVPVTDLYLYAPDPNNPGQQVVVIDPSTGRPAYNPLNKWNSGPVSIRGTSANSGGAMHLTSTPNTLQTEMQLAGGATIQRTCGNSVPQTLICCAQYGQAYRNSDPHIGLSVNQVVGGQLTGTPSLVALANPSGLYIQVPDLSAFTLPKDINLPKDASVNDCWQIVRGSETLIDPVTGQPFGASTGGGNFVLHAMFQIPSDWVARGVSFTVGDILDPSGQPIQWGGQVVQQMFIGLWARPLAAPAPPAVQSCVLPPPTGVQPPPTPVPPDHAQALQLFHTAVWNALYQASVPNPMNSPISLASNSTLIAPIVSVGAKNVAMSLTCSITPGPQQQLPTVDFGPGIDVQVTGYNPNINYAVPGNSYPSSCGVLSLVLNVSANAEPGLRGLTLTNYGDTAQPAMPALLKVVASI